MRRIKQKQRVANLLFGVLLLCFSGFFAQAQADIRDSYQSRSRPITLDAPIVGFDFYGLGLTGGVRVGIPIVANGFIPRLNNAVYINFGADFYYTGSENVYGVALGFPITLHWEFYFGRKWSAFAELGLNIFLYGGFFKGSGLLFSPRWLIGAVGGKFHLSRSFALVLRVGAPYTSFGLSFSF